MASVQTWIFWLSALTLLLGGCANRANSSGSAAGVERQVTTSSSGATVGSVLVAAPMPPSPGPTVDNENKFLKYLFNKYGSKGVISFEGLEHLMHSLGLGGLDFTGSHTLEEHRPDGYDFGDYDVYNGMTQQAQGEDGATSEPPVITFASAPTADTADRRLHNSPEQGEEEKETVHQHHQHDRDDHEHSHGQRQKEQHDREKNANGGEVDEHSKQRQQTSTSVNSTPPSAGPINTTQSNPILKSTTAVREGRPGDEDGHVWQEIIFKDMHDPRHRHPRNKNVPFCLSPMSIVHLVMEEPVLAAKQESYRRARSLAHGHHHGGRHGAGEQDEEEQQLLLDSRIEITPSEFKDLCPAFLVQLDQRACTQKLQQRAAGADPHREKKPFAHAWIYASACVLIISLCGLVGVAMVPLAKSIAYDDILRFLIALGVGTLCGDALMHLLPHALLPHDDGDDHSHDHAAGHGDHHSAEARAVWLCLCAFGAAFFMYSLEVILPLFRGGDGGHHQHGHSHGGHSQSNRVEPRAQAGAHNATGGGANGCGTRRADDIRLDLADPPAKEKEAKAMLAEEKKRRGAGRPMTAVAFMVVLGDGLHNITDGLAIGAAFAVDPVTGLATSFAILCHELPHELGDFALLLQTGVSIRRAIFLNIVSSVLSFIGMALGLLLTGLHASVVGWIYAGTAGTFLYIALSDLVPEMRNDLDRSAQKVKVILIQLAGLALGAIIMLLIALNEKSLQMLFD